MAAADACRDGHQRREGAPVRGLKASTRGSGPAVSQGGSAGPQSVTFRVEGMAPAPQGSKKHVGRGVMIESCRMVKPWRLLVAQSAVLRCEPACNAWKDWHWAAWSALRKSPGLKAFELWKQVGPRRYQIALSDIEGFVPTLAACNVKLEAGLLRGPVRLSVVFLFTRPAGHFRKDGSLKASAPAYHAVRPDCSKLLRSTEDALTGLAFEDDARIVGGTFDKRYCIGAERPGAIVTVIQLR